MTKPTSYSPETALERILRVLESELIAASDDEIAGVLEELGMKPGMKGSAATADIRYRWLRARYGTDPRRTAGERTEPPACDEDPKALEPSGNPADGKRV